MGIDLAPSHPGVRRADFLVWNGRGHLLPGRTLVIGNPPFGQRAALAFDFLEHAAGFADAIAFSLSRSFNKWIFQNRVRRTSTWLPRWTVTTSSSRTAARTK